MQFTLSLFQQLVENIPPLFPEDLKYQIRKDLKNIIENNSNLEDLEKIMIKYGYQIWPWSQAFKEMIAVTQENIAEQFLLANIPINIQEKYLEYRQLGMSLKDLHSGRMANYFDEEQRAILNGALVDMQIQLRELAVREVVGVKKDLYLKKVEEFKIILEEIEQNLNRLKNLADKEEDHPILADEIRARVETFEHGLCLLAPSFSHEEVGQAHDFFVGRKKELNHLRGIHETIEIDFYSQEQ
jgi:hypothetical protein